MVNTGDWQTKMIHSHCPSCGNYMIECNYKHEMLGFEHACYVCDWSALSLSGSGCKQQQKAYDDGAIKECIDIDAHELSIVEIGNDKNGIWWQIHASNQNVTIIIDCINENTCNDVYQYLKMELKLNK